MAKANRKARTARATDRAKLKAPHCPIHGSRLVMTQVMPGRRIVGVCKVKDRIEQYAGGDGGAVEEHHVSRREWVNR